MPWRWVYKDEVKLGAVLECPRFHTGGLEGFFFVQDLAQNVVTDVKPVGKMCEHETRRS